MVQCAKLLKPWDRHVGTYRHSLERISVFDANALPQSASQTGAVK